MTKFRTDSPVIITKNESADDLLRRLRKRLGFIESATEDEYLARRVSGAVIRFYDMGQVNTGSAGAPVWHDLPPVNIPAAVLTVSTDPPNMTMAVNTFDSAGWLSYRNQLLTPAPADWSSTYRRIDKTVYSPYGFSLKDKNDIFRYIDASLATDLTLYGYDWTQAGLKYKGLTRLEIPRNEEYLRFNTADSAVTKITDNPDPTSAAVPFTLSGNMDVFLVPKPALHTMRSYYRNFIPNQYATDYSDILGVYYAVHPREKHPFFVDHTFSQNSLTYNLDPNNIKRDYRNHRKLNAAARAWRVIHETNIAAGGNTFVSFQGTIDKSTFGTADNVNTAGTFYAREIGAANGFVFDVKPAGGATRFMVNTGNEWILTGLIKKGAQVFYLWDNAGVAAFDSSATIQRFGFQIQKT